MKEHDHSTNLSRPPFFQPAPQHPRPPAQTRRARLQKLLPSPPRPAGAKPPEETNQDHLQQKRDANPLQILSSPPRPARGTRKKKDARRSFTASPARPERKREGKHHAQNADTIASANDAADRALTPNLHTHERAGAPPHLTVPERRPEAEGSSRSAGATRNSGVALPFASLYCSQGRGKVFSPCYY